MKTSADKRHRGYNHASTLLLGATAHMWVNSSDALFNVHFQLYLSQLRNSKWFTGSGWVCKTHVHCTENSSVQAATMSYNLHFHLTLKVGTRLHIKHSVAFFVDVLFGAGAAGRSLSPQLCLMANVGGRVQIKISPVPQNRYKASRGTYFTRTLCIKANVCAPRTPHPSPVAPAPIFCYENTTKRHARAPRHASFTTNIYFSW